MNNNKIVLRTFTDADLATFASWINKDYVKKWLGEPEEWIAELKNETDEFSYYRHYIIEHESDPIGYCQYYECEKTARGYEWDHEPPSTFAIGYLIGMEAYLGKGYGRTILEMLCNQIMTLENPKRLIADPMPENIVSIRLLERHGFTLDPETGLYKLDI